MQLQVCSRRSSLRPLPHLVPHHRLSVPHQVGSFLRQLESPPARWAVGRGAIANVRAKVKRVTEETDAYESWSEGLELPKK